MKFGLFLGAGASVPFDKPTTSELKERLQGETSSLNEEILQSFLSNPEYSDIEYVFQAIRDIKKFGKSKGGEYFFTEGRNGIFEYKRGALPFDTFIEKINEIETILENAIFENYSWKSNSNQLLLKIYDEIMTFLKKKGQVHIFTTNYDKAIEQYCNLRYDKYRCIDGFVRNPPDSDFARWDRASLRHQQKIDDMTNVILYKLHGSLNWKNHVEQGLVRTNEEGKPSDPNFTKNMIIYPTLSPKNEEEVEPFNAILNEFDSFMKKVDGCIVIGFSFRDDGINETFKKLIKDGKTLVVISPHSMENVCENLLKVEVPQNFDKDKVSSMAPSSGNVWCIPDKLTAETILNNLRVAQAHVEQTLNQN